MPLSNNPDQALYGSSRAEQVRTIPDLGMTFAAMALLFSRAGSYNKREGGHSGPVANSSSRGQRTGNVCHNSPRH
ncbi:hypothetical protein HN512_05220 [Candidatus Peregrinibacteria bacterium]|jgi:hypothetical protein|nr:hypothetical protein [Candidatus Peregrinibacteria bacterium]MBT3599206.1 hypothetical protein [Candidatus Peregrinibacteria bacterium]MBT4366782.1 hypothetical protein [Candidatus Peregrinibacteria bacterium]MBT4585579.1 hypothetical protein [Candidatus Peregrinibacteria bacterium]MBT6731007.1 hypothetical protein [Candidatus Peregrinibacteria bacterium]